MTTNPRITVNGKEHAIRQAAAEARQALLSLASARLGVPVTALVAAASLVVLFRWKVSNPVLVAATAVIGLIAFPLLQPTWVFVK